MCQEYGYLQHMRIKQPRIVHLVMLDILKCFARNRPLIRLQVVRIDERDTTMREQQAAHLIFKLITINVTASAAAMVATRRLVTTTHI